MKHARPTWLRAYRQFLLLAMLFNLAACQQSVETSLAQAFLHLEAGELDLADALFRDVIIQDASNAHATFGRSLVMTEKGKWADAYAFSVRATALDPANVIYQRAAFDLEVDARSWNLALNRIDAVTFVSKQEAITLRARVLLGLSRPKKAYDLLMQQLDSYPALTAQAALAAHAASNAEKAKILFEAAKRLGIETRELAIAYLIFNKDDAPLLAWIEANPEDADLTLIAAEMRIRSGDFQVAKNILELSSRHRYRRIDHAITYLELLGLLRTEPEAMSLYLNLLPKNSALWQAANAYGNGLIKIQEGDADKAIVLLEQAASALPSRSRLQIALGMIYYADANFDLAKPNLEKGLHEIPSAGSAQLAFADVLVRDNNLSRASLHANLALLALPDSTQALELLALIDAKKGRPEQALDALNRASQIGPLSLSARVLEAQIYQTLERHEEALQAFMEMYKTGKPDFAILSGIVDSLVATDKLSEAIAFLAARPSPVTKRIAAILWIRTGNLTNAKKLLTKEPLMSADQLLAANIFALENDIEGLKGLAEVAANDHVRLVIASELARLGNFKQALSMFESLNISRPDEPNILNGIAYCIYELGLRERIGLAHTYAQRAYVTVPDNPHFKATLQDINERIQALDQSRLVVRHDPI
jgi:tetratricopeptide (TPR) repeat protein